MSRHGKNKKQKFNPVEKLRMRHGEHRASSGKRIRKHSSSITDASLEHLMDQAAQVEHLKWNLD
jgi:hypothetical protein